MVWLLIILQCAERERYPMPIFPLLDLILNDRLDIHCTQCYNGSCEGVHRGNRRGNSRQPDGSWANHCLALRDI